MTTDTQQPTLDEALEAVRPWAVARARQWGLDYGYAETVQRALAHVFPEHTPEVPKPSDEALSQARQPLVDKTIEWARETETCASIGKVLEQVFGAAEGDRWIHSDGFDCEGRDKDGLDGKGYDRDGYDRDGFRLRRDSKDQMRRYNRQGLDEDGYNRYGYNEEGYDRDGYDRDGYDRDGYDKDGRDRRGHYANPVRQATVIAKGLSPEARVELLKLLAAPTRSSLDYDIEASDA